jgi:hypothetical protein
VGGKGGGWGQGGEMTQALYAHMNNKIKKKKKQAGPIMRSVVLPLRLFS